MFRPRDSTQAFRRANIWEKQFFFTFVFQLMQSNTVISTTFAIVWVAQLSFLHHWCLTQCREKCLSMTTLIQIIFLIIIILIIFTHEHFLTNSCFSYVFKVLLGDTSQTHKYHNYIIHTSRAIYNSTTFLKGFTSFIRDKYDWNPWTITKRLNEWVTLHIY